MPSIYLAAFEAGTLVHLAPQDVALHYVIRAPFTISRASHAFVGLVVGGIGSDGINASGTD
jgi:hypothetical protein